MRDRLIELIEVARSEYYDYSDEIHKIGLTVEESSAEYIADYLLANGVIVPPCKVGDKVYVTTGDEEQSWIDEYKVKYFYYSSKGINRIYIECGTMRKNLKPKYIGKTVFLTREAAEQALKGGVE